MFRLCSGGTCLPSNKGYLSTFAAFVSTNRKMHITACALLSCDALWDPSTIPQRITAQTYFITWQINKACMHMKKKLDRCVITQ